MNHYLNTHIDLAKKYYPQFFNGDDFCLSKDRELFKKFVSDWIYSGLQKHFQQLNSVGYFNDNVMDSFFSLVEKWEGEIYTFHCEELVEAQKSFRIIVKNLSDLIWFETFDAGKGFHRVPPEWAEQQQERYYKTVKDINSLLINFNNSCEEMMCVAKRNNIF